MKEAQIGDKVAVFSCSKEDTQNIGNGTVEDIGDSGTIDVLLTEVKVDFTDDYDLGDVYRFQATEVCVYRYFKPTPLTQEEVKKTKLKSTSLASLDKTMSEVSKNLVSTNNEKDKIIAQKDKSIKELEHQNRHLKDQVEMLKTQVEKYAVSATQPTLNTHNQLIVDSWPEVCEHINFLSQLVGNVSKVAKEVIITWKTERVSIPSEEARDLKKSQGQVAVKALLNILVSKFNILDPTVQYKMPNDRMDKGNKIKLEESIITKLIKTVKKHCPKHGADDLIRKHIASAIHDFNIKLEEE